MTKNIDENNTLPYRCPVCGYAYDEKEWAEKCESWCTEHHSCNLDIIAHGVPEKPESA